VDIRNTVFHNTTATAGTYSCFKTSSTTLSATVTGCVFATSGGATVTFLELGSYTASSVFMESGNTFAFGANDTAYSYAPASSSVYVQLCTREQRWVAISGNATTLTVDSDQYAVVHITRTGVAACDISLNIAAPGSTLKIFVWNSGGGVSGAIGLVGSNIAAESAASTIADVNAHIYDLAVVAGGWLVLSERLDKAL